MKLLKLFGLVLLIIPFSSNLIAQRTSDIGVLISSDDNIKIILEFRKPIKEKYKLKFGVGYGNYFTSIFNGWYEIGTTDTSITSRKKHSNKDMFNLKIGMERQIKSGPFSVGLDFLVGYSKASYSIKERNYLLQDNGSWEYQYYTTTSDFTSIYASRPDTSYAYTSVNFFKPAIQLYLGLDFPLGKRFLVNLSFINSVGAVINIGDSYTVDPNNDFAYLKKTRIVFKSRFGVGLRYMFKERV